MFLYIIIEFIDSFLRLLPYPETKEKEELLLKPTNGGVHPK